MEEIDTAIDHAIEMGYLHVDEIDQGLVVMDEKVVEQIGYIEKIGKVTTF
jgi:hypothetical protein